jgi:hypothetical protein
MRVFLKLATGTATADSLANLNAVAVGSGLNDLGCDYAAIC